MATALLESLRQQTDEIRDQGLYKAERLIAGPQQAAIAVRANGGTNEVINLCANNYLGLANHPAVIDARASSARRVRVRDGVSTLHLRHADNP